MSISINISKESKEIINKLREDIREKRIYGEKRVWHKIFNKYIENKGHKKRELIILDDNKIFVRYDREYIWIYYKEIEELVEEENIEKIIRALKEIGAKECESKEFFYRKNLEEPLEDQEYFINNIIQTIKDNIINKLKRKEIEAIETYLYNNYHLEDYRLFINIYDNKDRENFEYFITNDEIEDEDNLRFLKKSDIVYGDIELPKKIHKTKDIIDAKYNPEDTIIVFSTSRTKTNEKTLRENYIYSLNIYIGSK